MSFSRAWGVVWAGIIAAHRFGRFEGADPGPAGAGSSSSSSSSKAPWKFSVDQSDSEDAFRDDVLEVPVLHHKLKARPSPFITDNHFGGGFVSNDDRVAMSALRYASSESIGAECMTDEEEGCMVLPQYAVRAGAREVIYMNPGMTKVAIVTCGGLCPGLNDVVQGLVAKCEDYGGCLW